MVHRVHIVNQNHVNRLRSMAHLARSILKRQSEYKVVFAVETNRTGKAIKLEDLRNDNSSPDLDDDAKWGDPDAVIGYSNGVRKRMKVHCFQQKDDIKAMMIQDNYLWARRPLPINLLLYAAVDGWLSRAMGQYYCRQFKQWQIDKTMLVSLRFCQIVASKKSTRRGSSRVSTEIVKLIRGNTAMLDLGDIPLIDSTENDSKKRKYGYAKVETVDIDVDNLLLMAHSRDFVANALQEKGRMGKCKRAPEIPRLLLNRVTDIQTFKYDKDKLYVHVGKMLYDRVVPLKLIGAM